MCASRPLESRVGESRLTRKKGCVREGWHASKAMMCGTVKTWNPTMLKSAGVKKVCRFLWYWYSYQVPSSGLELRTHQVGCSLHCADLSPAVLTLRETLVPPGARFRYLLLASVAPLSTIARFTIFEEINGSLQSTAKYIMKIRPRSDLMPVPGNGARVLNWMEVIQTRQCPEPSMVTNN